jgi:hypothetical protein
MLCLPANFNQKSRSYYREKHAMRHLTWFILLSFFTPGLWAQNQAEDIFNHPLKPETRNAFNLTCVQLAEHPIVRGNFEQEKKLNRLNRSLKSSGNFIIVSDTGMVWETLKPFPSTLALGKDFLIQSRPGGKKTVLNAQGNETFVRLAEVLSAVFSGNSQKLLDGFEVYYSGTSAAWELGLAPVDKAIAAFIGKIVMQGGKAIHSIVIHEQNGDSIVYFLSNHNYPMELSVNEKEFFTIP